MSDLSARRSSKSVFREQRPQFVSADGKERTWITRGGNFAICYSEMQPGATVERRTDAEEHMIILPPGGAEISVEARGARIEAAADSLTIVPPGDSRITVGTGGIMVRIMPKAASDVMALSANAAAYADGAPELAPATPWPAPHDGFRLRHYPLAQYAKADGPRIQPRAFRSTNMLVNIFVHYRTRRGGTGLSPHWHDDFEQASLCLDGTWVHHMRYNWGADSALWWPDDHEPMATPSVIIIPARAIHTSQDIGEDGPESSLYDIFCPPRLDFAAKKGFCLNEDEYPLPHGADVAAVKTGGTLLAWQKPA